MAHHEFLCALRIAGSYRRRDLGVGDFGRSMVPLLLVQGDDSVAVQALPDLAQHFIQEYVARHLMNGAMEGSMIRMPGQDV